MLKGRVRVFANCKWSLILKCSLLWGVRVWVSSCIMLAVLLPGFHGVSAWVLRWVSRCLVTRRRTMLFSATMPETVRFWNFEKELYKTTLLATNVTYPHPRYIWWCSFSTKIVDFGTGNIVVFFSLKMEVGFFCVFRFIKHQQRIIKFCQKKSEKNLRSWTWSPKLVVATIVTLIASERRFSPIKRFTCRSRSP